MVATKKVKIDINYPEFLASLKRMEKKDQTRVIDTFEKLSNIKLGEGKFKTNRWN
jgi:hypothetical protein